MLQKSNDSAVEPDHIHYKLLTNLPESPLSLLLTVFNSIWKSGIFPPSWREATVAAIPKPGKDSSDPNNYRLIIVTSCLSETVDRMVNRRLMWVLESKGLLASEQCGLGEAVALQIIWFVLIVASVMLLPKKRTRYCNLLWCGKSLRHRVETRYTTWSLRPWFSRPSAYFHWWVRLSSTVLNESWLHSAWYVGAGDGCSPE